MDCIKIFQREGHENRRVEIFSLYCQNVKINGIDWAFHLLGRYFYAP